MHRSFTGRVSEKRNLASQILNRARPAVAYLDNRQGGGGQHLGRAPWISGGAIFFLLRQPIFPLYFFPNVIFHPERWLLPK